MRGRGTIERLGGFGRAQSAVSRVYRPESVDALQEHFDEARRDARPLALRGAGKSYGDAALNSGGPVLDLSGLDRVLDFDPDTGLVDVEPGVTIDQLWRRTLPAGFWPPVVPGTSFATLGGIAAMNAHGKNCFRVGPVGDQIDELDLLLPNGERVTCAPDRSPELFDAAIGGFGMLGVLTRLRLRLKRVYSGWLNVRAIPAPTLGAMFDVFEQNLADADYLVGWCDALASGAARGRGVVHRGDYLAEGEDPEPGRSLAPETQDPPAKLFGVLPRTELWRAVQLFQHRPGMRLVNAVKNLGHRLDPRRRHRWTHAEFGFLLDYMGDFNRAYGSGGLIQVQPFLPDACAREVFAEILGLAERAGLPPYLVVLKRHRPDRFLLSHGLDGWSLAMDFPASKRDAAWNLAHEIQDRAIAAGGRFYFAKDSTLTSGQVRRMYPAENLDRFSELKRKCDPDGLLQTDLARRVVPDLFS